MPSLRGVASLEPLLTGPGCDLLAQGRAALAGLHHLRLNLFPHPGDAQKEGGANLPKIVAEQVKALGEGGARPHLHWGVEADDLLGDVAQGEVADEAVVAVSRAGLSGGLGRPGDIGVGDHNPFGVSGGAGGVDEGAEVIGPLGAHALLKLLCGYRLGELREICPPMNVVCWVCALHQDDGLEFWEALFDRLDFGELLVVFHDDDGGLAVVGDVLALLGAVGGVDPGGDSARIDRGDVCDKPLDTIVADNGDPVLTFEPQRHERPRDQANLSAVIAPANALPTLVHLGAERGKGTISSRGRFHYFHYCACHHLPHFTRVLIG